MAITMGAIAAYANDCSNDALDNALRAIEQFNWANRAARRALHWENIDPESAREWREEMREGYAMAKDYTECAYSA